MASALSLAVIVGSALSLAAIMGSALSLAVIMASALLPACGEKVAEGRMRGYCAAKNTGSPDALSTTDA